MTKAWARWRSEGRMRSGRVCGFTVACASALAVLVGLGGVAAGAKKINACTIVPKANLEAAFGNAFDAPENTSIASFKASCRFPSTDLNGADLNMFLSNDVKGGIKDAIGSYFATKKS